MPETPTISWTMSLDHANTVLAVLGEQPFNKIAPLLLELRTQAERQCQTWQQQNQTGASQGGMSPPGRMNGGGGDAEHAA